MSGSEDRADASSSSTDAVRLAERYVAAYTDRDLDAFLAVLDEEVVSYPTPLFGHRPNFGHAGVRAWWAEMMASSRRFDIVVKEIRQIEPDRVAVLGAIHNGDSGRRLGPWTVIVRVRNGRIVESRSYLTDEEMS
jgi:ketosteroid isomerase-like protein